MKIRSNILIGLSLQIKISKISPHSLLLLAIINSKRAQVLDVSTVMIQDIFDQIAPC